MGYGTYVLPDGREAGYLVEAECDLPTGCATPISRGLDALCGESPDGHRSPDEPGCGRYHCGPHQDDHQCANPRCGAYSAEGGLVCHERAEHAMPHRDVDSGETFERTEDDVLDEDGMVPA